MSGVMPAGLLVKDLVHFTFCLFYLILGLLVDPSEENNEIRLVSFLNSDQENSTNNLIDQTLAVDEQEPATMTPSLSVPPVTQPVQQKEITLKDFCKYYLLLLFC